MQLLLFGIFAGEFFIPVVSPEATGVVGGMMFCIIFALVIIVVLNLIVKILKF